MTPARAPRGLSTVTSKVAGMVAAQLQIAPAAISPGSRLVGDLGMDSLAAAEIVIRLEEGFDIEFGLDAVDALSTVQTVTDLATLVASCLPGAPRRARK